MRGPHERARAGEPGRRLKSRLVGRAPSVLILARQRAPCHARRVERCGALTTPPALAPITPSQRRGWSCAHSPGAGGSFKCTTFAQVWRTPFTDAAPPLQRAPPPPPPLRLGGCTSMAAPGTRGRRTPPPRRATWSCCSGCTCRGKRSRSLPLYMCAYIHLGSVAQATPCCRRSAILPAAGASTLCAI
jgi:hypothetical protein